MARKVHAHKRSNETIKTPQNSQELRVETTSKIRYPKAELPYSSQVDNYDCSSVASVRKLMNEELFKQSSARNNAPNLVARLMGLDMMMPLDTKSIVNNSYSNVTSVRKLMNDDELSKQSSTKVHNNDPNLVARLMGLDIMMPLETKSIVLSDHSTSENVEKKIAKKGMYGRKSSSNFNSSSWMEFGSFDQHINDGGWGQSLRKPMPRRRAHEEELQKLRRELEAYQAAQENLSKEMAPHNAIGMMESFPSRNRTQSRDLEESLVMKSTRRLLDISSSPTTHITVLKPGSDWICDCNYEENRISSSGTLQGRTSIEDFLEEVREQLVCELQGKTVKKSSASRNVVKSEVHCDISELFNPNIRLNQVEDTIKQSQILKDENEAQAGSFRHEPNDNMSSPRNLLRSLSAPVSGTSFGRFALEDHHILRNLETVETMHVNVKKQNKHRFDNIKEKVSNFKHRFGLRGKFLVKRIQSMVEPCRDHDGVVVSDIRSGPTVLMKHNERHENFTEVPPSPASVCSSDQEELWCRTGYLSPISAQVASLMEDNVMPEVNRDINSSLNEVSIQLSQLESDVPEELVTTLESVEYELVQLEDPAESYIRDLLVASGMYFGSCDKHLSRGDKFAEPIGNSVFEEVKESHKKYLVKENYEIENKLEHKILLDLLNEALSIVLGPPLTKSRLRRKVNKFYMQNPPCGKELLKLVWDIINVSWYPPSNFSLDSVVARDIGSISWCGLIDDHINIFEREISCLIIDDLVEEFIKEISALL